jgi:hypothetical protein
VPHLRRSIACFMDPALPGWAVFGAGPPGLDRKTLLSHVHSILDLPQASQPLDDKKERTVAKGQGGCWGDGNGGKLVISIDSSLCEKSKTHLLYGRTLADASNSTRPPGNRRMGMGTEPACCAAMSLA